MKRLSIFAIILMATCTVAMAQPRAIGGRIGWGIGPSYQHQIGEKNMIQADLDFLGYGWWGVQATATFNWLIPLLSVDAGALNLYPGVGIGGGYEWLGNRVYFLESNAKNWGTGFIGVAGMIGIEWSFKFPLQLSFEYRPLIGPCFYNKYTSYWDGTESVGVDFYYHGLYSGAIAIGVRYKFGK
ncbi:MAG: hypothetical protein FWC10_01235 [Lentimicrobiaceae bacterium]|nr:hypothetical protein [Lentimicrobiaceae bacterium]